MRGIILATIGLLSVASEASLAADLPSRYAPPPVIGGGPGNKVGVLNCRIAPSVGFLVVGVQQMACRFTPDGPAPLENYAGTMTTVGIDIGITGEGALHFPRARVMHRMLPL